ncbi:MAG TPA: type VI secretion system protein TssA [Acetobacteraceae bacterium]|nr:type VI secretion system protein TssA [Acetobacteraceae bacterium]
MPPLDSGAWLVAVSDDSPAGPNLEFDPDFAALDRTAEGTPERQAGDTIIPAEDPDWKQVEAQALALLQRTRDLRVLGHLAIARLHLAGPAEYTEVLAVVRQLLETRWDEVHPQLDPEDDNDPTLRANALLRLGHPGLVLKFIRDFPLAISPRLGRYSWRDIGVATGAIPSEAEDKPTESLIRSAFQDSDPARLGALRTSVAAAGTEAAGIAAAFDAKAGVGTGPDFTELTKLLAEVGRYVDRYAVTATDSGATDDAGVADGQPGQGAPAEGAVAGRSAGMRAAALTEVTTRADALRLLDLVCQYYRRNEPSSPLPLLVERARRLADKDFLDVLRDLAPDAVGQAQIVVGTRDE